MWICISIFKCPSQYFNFGSNMLPPGWGRTRQPAVLFLKFNSTLHRVSNQSHSFDPTSHLRLQNPCNFCTLDRFHRSCQVAVVNLSNSIPADILLRGDSDGWRTVLKAFNNSLCIYSECMLAMLTVRFIKRKKCIFMPICTSLEATI